ncbi:hypothetical protein BDC45DRAFT_533474 [Circinella umbellata]|nr:hypothetical protein BDC45DRAFT_533474 [Circinella umbellata]
MVVCAALFWPAAIDKEVRIIGKNLAKSRVSWKLFGTAPLICTSTNNNNNIRNGTTSPITDNATTSNSSSHNTSLTANNCQYVQNMYENLQPYQKWWINASNAGSVSGQVERVAVEDKMKLVALKYLHHQQCLEKYFSPEELHQINTFKPIELPPLPESLKDYLLSYNGKNTLDELLKHRKLHDFDPIVQSDLFWAQLSIIQITNLFLHRILPTNDDTEADLVHRKWGFIQSCFDDSEFRVQSNIAINVFMLIYSGEKMSLSSSIRKNMDRSTNEQGQLDRKAVGAKVDLVIKHGDVEYSCIEAGCSDDPFNTKAINEGCLKLP